MNIKEPEDVRIRINPCVQSAIVFLKQGEQMLKVKDKNCVSFFRYYAAPCAVNLAFACELYLKALRAKEHSDIAKKTHYLKYLFYQLESDTQDEVRKEYEKFNTLQEFDECLDTHNNAFIEWRYYYEITEKNKSFEPMSLYRLAVSLNHVYCNREGIAHAD